MASNEYRLLSLTESLRLRTEAGPDRLLDELVPLLEAGCELAVAQRVLGASGAVYVNHLLDDLTTRGLLEVEPPAGEPAPSSAELDRHANQVRFLANFEVRLPPNTAAEAGLGTSVVQMQAGVNSARVLLVGLGRLGRGLARMLASAGVGTVYGVDARPHAEDLQAFAALAHDFPDTRFTLLGTFDAEADRALELPAGSSLLVVCQDVFDPGAYEMVNRTCLQRGMNWTSVRNLGLRIEIGPTIVPRETACFTCYRLRRLSNDPAFAEREATSGQLASVGRHLGALDFEFADGLAAVEIIKILTNFSTPATYSAVFAFDVLTFTSRVHPVLKIPRCSACARGGDERPATSVWNFQASGEGTWRL